MLANVFKKCLIPAAAVLVESKIKTVAQNDEDFCRPSELPLYAQGRPISNQIQPIPEAEAPTLLQNTVKTVRQTITKYSAEAQAYKRVGGEHLERSKEQLEGLITYLHQEDNTLPKAGAIGIGALTGLIFGLRGGIFKKILYGTSGALGMAAVCYRKKLQNIRRQQLSKLKNMLQ